MCYPLFQTLLQSNLATFVMHAEPAPLSAAPSWWRLVSFIPCFLRFMQPFPFPFLGLCALHAMIALFYLSLFSLYHAKSYCYLLFRPMSTSPFLLILGFLPSYHLRGGRVTSYQTALFFIFLSFSWRKDSSGCMPGSGGKMGKMRGGHCWDGTC